MEMLNRAIEDAALFKQFVGQLDGTDAADERRYRVVDDHRPGENRAERRARQRAELAAAKLAKRVAA